MQRLSVLLASAAIVAVAAAPRAIAQQQPEQDGLFQSLEDTAKEKVLVLSGGRRFGVPGTLYLDNKTFFDSLEAGERVLFVLDAQGRLKAIRRPEQVQAGPRRTTQVVTFQKIVQRGNQRWLVHSSGELPISEVAYERHERTLLFLKRNDPVRVSIEGGFVQDLVTGGQVAQKPVDPAIQETIDRSKSGHKVTINGKLYRFLSSNLIEVRLQPMIPGTDRDPKFEGELAIKLVDIASFVNDEIVEESPTEPGVAPTGSTVNDAFKGIQVGDTVGIEFDIGQITGLTDTHYTWRVWRNDEWSAEGEPTPRAGVTNVRPVSLSSQHTMTIEGAGGDVHLKISRKRLAGSLSFEVEVSHSLPGTILVGSMLQFHLGDLSMTPDSKPLGTEEEPLPALFEGQVVKVKHGAQLEGVFDGRVEVLVDGEDRVSLTSAAARGHLLAALEQAASAKDPESMTRVYVAAGKNGDKDIARLLAVRALALEGEPLRRAPIVEGLAAFGPIAPEVIIQELVTADRNVQSTRLDKGEIRRVPLPGDERPLSYKRRLIGLMAEIPGALKPPFGGQLFDLYREREELVEAIDVAFTRRPGEAVASLLDVATSTNSASKPEEIERAEKAAGLLTKLGAAVLDEIVKELRRRDIPVDQLQRSIEQAGPERAGELVGMSLSTLIADAVRKKRLELDQRVERARVMVEAKQLLDAAETLRSVLAQDKGHGPALEVMPGVLTTIAEDLRKSGDRVGAGAHYDEALALMPPAEQPRTKAILAELYLAAIEEEVEENVVRDAAHDLARKVKTLPINAPVRGPELTLEQSGWVELQISAEKKGYIRTKCLLPGGRDQEWQVRDAATPIEILDVLLKRVSTLSPTLDARCNQIRGRAYARDAKAAYEAEDYVGALPLFKKAAELAPNDERLSLQWGCWVKAYKTHFAAVVGLILVLGLIVGASTFARPRRVKWVGDYKHYGQKRAQHERDLEVEEGASPPADGGAPAEAPAPGADGAPPQNPDGSPA